jgi:hypothetical protein
MSSSYWGGHVLVDPTDMERMFSEEDSLSQLPSVWEDVQEESLGDLSLVREILDQIPPREADFIELYFFLRLRQTAIAELYNISQPSVVYRLQRGAKRLRYLIEMPDYDRQQLEVDLRGVIGDPLDVEIMLMMIDLTCQSKVARQLHQRLIDEGRPRRITQGFVRHRYLRTIEKLERLPEMDNYVRLFKHIAEYPNIMNSTCRASWDEETIFSIQ